MSHRFDFKTLNPTLWGVTNRASSKLRYLWWGVASNHMKRKPVPYYRTYAVEIIANKEPLGYSAIG